LSAEVVAATAAYEAWMRRRIAVVAPDLKHKHEAMAASAFEFMRATFYRFVPLWQRSCPELTHAPKLLAVGDLHVENFGTWRDAEGRLAWGVNDFDEAYQMPYTIDLVRLAASALLAIREDRLRIGASEACAALLEGYGAMIGAEGGAGFVLEEKHPALRVMALGEERDPERFWQKLGANKAVKAPAAVRRMLRRAVPEVEGELRILHRVAGLGSLGRPRYVAIGRAQGGMIAREAKAMLPSAFAWANGIEEERFFCGRLAARAVRSCDPFYGTEKAWVLRRLAPHCTAIPLADFPKRRDERRILEAMGRETANVHWGTPDKIGLIRRDLKRREGSWLRAAAATMADATLQDWRAWRKARG
jgi:Uncharacterized protein conserved in bacteria (DUF2252)